MRKKETNMTLYTPKYIPNGDEEAIIKTSKGEIRVQLHGDDAPIHVGNFVELALKGYYDGLKFHRFEPNFVIQGGCPNTRDMAPIDVAKGKSGAAGAPGTGGPGYHIKGEFKTNPHNEHKDGTLAMARAQDPDSAGSQFYFCLGAQPFLDSGYTVFGDCLQGLDVIHALRAGDVIESVIIENANE